jgi:TPR repeat protein
LLSVDDIEVEQNVLNKAQDGDGSSLFKIGQIYYDKSDYTKAIDWFRLGAAKDNPSSQFQIGSMYDHGQDLPVDYKLAMEWYLKAYHNGSIAATNNIGCLYGNAQGVARDYKLALKWFLEAVNKNDSCSQYNVGSYYEKGHGVKVDKQYALEWFEKSDKQGYEEAKSGIKRLNEQGYYIGDRQKSKYL